MAQFEFGKQNMPGYMPGLDFSQPSVWANLAKAQASEKKLKEEKEKQAVDTAAALVNGLAPSNIATLAGAAPPKGPNEILTYQEALKNPRLSTETKQGWSMQTEHGVKQTDTATAGRTATADRSRKQTRNRRQALDKEEANKAAELVSGRPRREGMPVIESLADTKRGAEDLAAEIENYKRILNNPAERRVDWSPLVPLASGWMKTLLPGAPDMDYTPPEVSSPEDRALAVAKLKNALQTQRLGITNAEADIYKAQFGNSLQDILANNESMKLMEELRRALEQRQGTTNNITQTNGSGVMGYNPNSGRGGSGNKGKSLTEGAIDKITHAQTAISSLSSLRDAISANKDVMGPIAGQASKSPFTFGIDKVSRSKELRNQIMDVRQSIGKMREGGVLRAEDERKYKRMIGDIDQDPAVTINNLMRMEPELRKHVDNYIANHGRAGYNVEDFGDVREQYGPGGMTKPPATGGLSPEKQKRLEELRRKAGR